jgi:hypothetical protein
MKNKTPVNIFKSIGHPHLDKAAFRITFIKAAWKAYTDIEKLPISQQQFQVSIGKMYDWIFLERSKESSAVLSEVRELFRNSEAVERFLTDTFYIVLNHYIKSFYGELGGWDKIIPFATGIERFITYVSNRLDEESFFIFEDALINTLEKFRRRSKTISVLNTYYGVPIQYPAHILHTDPESVTIRVHPLQETAALLQNGIYLLQNGEFINDVFASVIPTTVDGERALILSRFDQLETSLFHRQSVRVQPSNPLLFTIKDPNLSVKCYLYDISIGGIAVISKHPYTLSESAKIGLVFPPDILNATSEMIGHLIFKSSYKGGYKYHFKLEPTQQQEDELSKYIARREQEIIKKLRDEIV